jgi:hypothetical protein
MVGNCWPIPGVLFALDWIEEVLVVFLFKSCHLLFTASYTSGLFAPPPGDLRSGLLAVGASWDFGAMRPIDVSFGLKGAVAS